MLTDISQFENIKNKQFRTVLKSKKTRQFGVYLKNLIPLYSCQYAHISFSLSIEY